MSKSDPKAPPEADETKTMSVPKAGKIFFNLGRTKTMSVPKAGKIFFNLGRDASYRAAKSGQIPAIWIGGKVLAVVPAIERMLAEAGRRKPAA
jgi:hypothetical protein